MKQDISHKHRLLPAPVLAAILLTCSLCPETHAFNPCRGQVTTNYCGRPGMLEVLNHNNLSPIYHFLQRLPNTNRPTGMERGALQFCRVFFSYRL